MIKKYKVWVPLVFSELKNSKIFGILFVLNLSLGLIGFLTLDSFKTSIHDNIQERSKSILAADLGITAQRELSKEELEEIDKILPKNKLLRKEISLFSMASTATNSRLVSIRAIDDQFPFYGELVLESSKSIDGKTPVEINDKQLVWLYPELKTQLNVAIGETIKIGELEFEVADIVDQDPSVSTVSFVSVAKIYMGIDYLSKTGLLKKGSRVYRSNFYKFPEAVDLEQTVKELKQVLTNSDIRITSHDNASPQFARILNYLNDYLGLVSLVALFLAGVGSAFLFRSHLSKRLGDIAILLSMGLNGKLARRIYAAHLVILGTIATAATTLLSLAIIPLLPLIFEGMLGADQMLYIPLKSVLLTAALGIGGSILFCSPLLNRIKSLNPATLFQEDASPSIDLSKKQMLGFLPVIVVYWLLAIFQANSVLMGSLFVAIFLASSLIFALFCWFAINFIAKKGLQGPLVWRMAALNLARHKTATIACFLAISLGAMLLNIIPQIRDVVSEELSRPKGVDAPSLFLFDIQDEQVDPLRQLITDSNAAMNYLSPLIQARLLKIDGVDIGQRLEDGTMETRESERSDRMRNRTYNLSYRGELASSETIVRGEPFSGKYDWNSSEPVEVSLEVRFADRIGVDLGSTLEFDVGGVIFTSKVVSIRRIKWTSFHPNFFVQLQTGVLEDAPKSFVAAIPNLNFEEKLALQNTIVEKFSNISIVDVTKTIERITSLMDQITKAIGFMALLTLIAGFAVLFSIAGHQSKLREKDHVLLKVLGTKFGNIKRIVFLEFSFLGFLAALLGAGVSIGVSFILASVLFDGAWVFSWQTPVYSTVAITLLCVAMGYLATSQSLRKPANSILN